MKSNRDVSLEEILSFIEMHISFQTEKEIMKIQNSLDLDVTPIEDALKKCAGNIYFYLTNATAADGHIEQVKFFMDRREAEFMRNFRLENPQLAFKEKEADIKRFLFADEEWVTLQKLMMSLKTISKRYSNIAHAFDVQSRLLTSLNRRELFKNEF